MRSSEKKNGLKSDQNLWKITVKKVIFSKVAGRETSQVFFQCFWKIFLMSKLKDSFFQEHIFPRIPLYSCLWILESHLTGKLWMSFLNVFSRWISLPLVINMLKWKLAFILNDFLFCISQFVNCCSVDFVKAVRIMSNTY